MDNLNLKLHQMNSIKIGRESYGSLFFYLYRPTPLFSDVIGGLEGLNRLTK